MDETCHSQFAVLAGFSQFQPSTNRTGHCSPDVARGHQLILASYLALSQAWGPKIRASVKVSGPQHPAFDAGRKSIATK